MKEQHFNEELFNGDELPIPVPSVDRAWGGMEKLLNKELPVMYKASVGRWLGIQVAVAVTMSVCLNSATTENLRLKTSGNRESGSAKVNAATLSLYDLFRSGNKGSGETKIDSTTHSSSDLFTAENRQSKADSARLSPFDLFTAKSRQSKATAKVGSAKLLADDPFIAQNKEAAVAGTDSATLSFSSYHSSASENSKSKSVTTDTIQSHPGSENKKTTLDLATLPLQKDNWKSLTHRDMQVSVPAIAGKPDKFNLWIQLNVPISANKYYFIGPNGTAAFYRSLIPSLRIERVFGRSAVSAELHPYNIAFMPVKKVTWSSDTTATEVNNQIAKQFGPEITLQYHYPVNKNLYISGGIGASWWRKAITVLAKDTFPATVLPSGTGDWKGHPRYVFTADVEVYYEFNKWQLGLRAGVPLNKDNRVKVELLLRRRIRWPSFFSLHN